MFPYVFICRDCGFQCELPDTTFEKQCQNCGGEACVIIPQEGELRWQHSTCN